VEVVFVSSTDTTQVIDFIRAHIAYKAHNQPFQADVRQTDLGGKHEAGRTRKTAVRGEATEGPCASFAGAFRPDKFVIGRPDNHPLDQEHTRLRADAIRARFERMHRRGRAKNKSERISERW
jgi:hypothetical protein